MKGDYGYVEFKEDECSHAALTDDCQTNIGQPNANFVEVDITNKSDFVYPTSADTEEKRKETQNDSKHLNSLESGAESRVEPYNSADKQEVDPPMSAPESHEYINVKKPSLQLIKLHRASEENMERF